MIREATVKDVDKILYFIKQLAIYEKMEDEVTTTIDTLKEWIFEKNGAKVIFVCVDNKEIGMALYFYNYSTFNGKCGLYLEDLFVLPEYRGKGYGIELINALKDIVKKEGLGRFEWECLDWNTPSIEFYTKKLKATPMSEWTRYRLKCDEI